MFSLILATALTAGTTAPGTHFFHGCHGCYGAVPVYVVPVYKVPVVPVYKVTYGTPFFGSSACFGGCFGGCGGCNGCCGGCYGSYGCYGSCYGSCYGCCGGCYGSCYGTWAAVYPAYAGCGGCCGGVVAPNYAPAKLEEKKPEEKKPEGGIKEKEVAATVQIVAPMDVEVTLNGVAVPRKRETESFKTPALVVGQPYHYTVKAKRGDVVETKVVSVEAGATVEIDLRDMKTSVER